MKDHAKAILCALYKYSGVMHAQETVSSWAGRSFLSILLFHRVTDEIPLDDLTVGAGWFRRMCGLLRRQFHVVPLGEIFRVVRAGQRFPRRTLAITFDDCYRDNLFAARVLSEHGLPATFFVPTAYVGTDHVFAWDRGLKQMANLTWDDVHEMLRLGHEIGSHTVTHADLAQAPEEQARRELVESKKTLEDKLHRPVRWFAYPFGGRNNFLQDHLPLVTEAGYEGCVSGFGGFIYPHATKPILPREPAPGFRSLLNLELHLRGCLHWVYALKRRVGLW